MSDKLFVPDIGEFEKPDFYSGLKTERDGRNPRSYKRDDTRFNSVQQSRNLDIYANDIDEENSNQSNEIQTSRTTRLSNRD